MASTEVNGVQIAYDEAGSGPAVVLCHAGIADRRMWDHQVSDLAHDHRVIRYDWRGYGQSGPARGDYSHHLDLLALMDALSVSDAVLVGCSMGGAYAVDAALASPARVTGLVLISSGLSGHEWPAGMWDPLREQVQGTIPAERLRAYRDGTAERVLTEDVEAMAAAQARFMVAGPRRSAADLDPAVWASAMTMLRTVFGREWSEHPSAEQTAQPPAVSRLSQVDVPTLVINGGEDVPAIQEVCDLLVDGIHGARRLDLASTAHLPPLERPDQVTTAVRDHIARIAGVP